MASQVTNQNYFSETKNKEDFGLKKIEEIEKKFVEEKQYKFSLFHSVFEISF